MSEVFFTDSHSHIHGAELVSDMEDILKRAGEKAVLRIVAVGTSCDDSVKAAETAEKYCGVYASAGIHPEYAEIYDRSSYDKLLELSRKNRVIAIGESGLDFHYEDGASKASQELLFRDMITLSKETGKPLIIHSRDAMDDTLDILDGELSGGRGYGGIFHCFDGSENAVKWAVDNGFYISFAGNVTFKNAENLRRALLQVPDDMLLVETDCPYLSPVPVRGKVNEPANVIHTAEFIAKHKNIDIDELSFILEDNFCRLFGSLEKGYEQ